MAFQLNKTFTAEKANSGVEFEYVDPATGKGTGAFVTMRGFESKAYRDYQTEKSRKELTKKAKDKELEAPKTAEELHEEAVDMFVVLFAGWRGFTDESGNEIKPDDSIAWQAFDQSEPLRSQALAAITGPASFLPSA